MDDTAALAYIEERLASKNTSTLGKKIMALQGICKNPDPNVARLASHMLKYTEQQLADERFSVFIIQKARLLGKRPHELRPDEVSLARAEFDMIERTK